MPALGSGQTLLIAAAAADATHRDGSEIQREYARHWQGERRRALRPHAQRARTPARLPYKGAQQLGHGTDYKYSHDHEGGWVDQAYLPEERHYYEPVDRGYEAEIKERIESLGEPSKPAQWTSAGFHALPAGFSGALLHQQCRDQVHTGWF